MPYLGGAVAANVNDDDALDARLHDPQRARPAVSHRDVRVQARAR